MTICPETLDFMINHIILPPKLPQADDSDFQCEISLAQLVHDQAIKFQANVPVVWRQCWTRTIKMLKTWLEVKEHGYISKEALSHAIMTLLQQGRFYSDQTSYFS